MTFEENLTELSRIVAELEKGELPLAESVMLYEKGVKLSESCKKELDSAKLKISEN
ncbi:MAG: exodeoxyribonuclease VII small subunit [Porcipelethomonas sp.]